jgi:hypothetical protein
MSVYRSTDLVTTQTTNADGSITETTANAFAYGANIIDNGNGYEGAYVIHDGETITLGGVIRNTVALVSGNTLLQLCPELSPNKIEQIQVVVNSTSVINAEVDIDGRVVTKQAIGVSGIINLNSVKFLYKNAELAQDFVPETDPYELPAEEYHTITASELKAGATIYGGSFEPPAWEVDMTGRVTLKGLINTSAVVNDGSTLFTLPVGLRPKYTRIFTVKSSDLGQVRLDIGNSGAVVLQFTGATSVPFCSLDGVSFIPEQ